MVEIDQEINDHRISYEQVKEFLDSLNQSGFELSVRQYTSANRLLLGLMSSEWILRNPHSLRTYLAPVVCSSPSEQQEFYRLFDGWLTPPEPSAGSDADEVDSTLSSSSTTYTTPNTVLVKRNVIKYAVPMLLIAVSVSLYYVWLQTKQRTLTVRVFQANTSTPIPYAQVSFAGQDAVTDSTGSYQFTYRLRNATPTVRASSQGVSNTIPVTKNDQSVELALNLNPAGKDIGKIPDVLPGTSPTPTPTFEVSSSRTIEGSVSEQKQVTATNQWSTTDVYLRYFVLILVGVVALPFIIYLIWQIWRMLRRRQLERWRMREQPDIFSLAVRGVANHLYRRPAFRTFAQELRRHRRLKSNTLDASASVEATASAGGLFTPVYEYRQLTPDYLILVDAKSFQDQKAHLDEEIVKRLQKEGVFVDQYYFNGDPRVCQSRQPKTVYRTLEQMATRHPDHRLVVFSDGAGLIDPLSGRPHSWIEQFSQWSIRALITAEPNWGYRELALQKTGLEVLPAAEEGLVALGKLTRNVEDPPRSPIIDNQDEDFYPPRLLENPTCWIARKSPPPEEIEELSYELRYYLGHEGFYLLCACAVYPALIWDLTLYFSSHLVDSKNVESVLAALVRLPWFRTSEMPDWLRSHLISRLPPPREATVRKLLERLLVSYVENPKQGFDLEFAREPAPESKPWRERLVTTWRTVREWKRKKFLQDVIRTAPDDSLFRDYVFLNFMSRSKLAVLLPWRLRRLLYSKGQPILGLHPVRALVLPLVVAIVGGLTIVAMGTGLTTGGEFGPVSFPSPSPPTTTPSPAPFDPEVYKVRLTSNLPAEIPALKGLTYSNALTFAESAVRSKYGTQIRLSVTNATVVDPSICAREVGVATCVDVIFNVENQPPTDRGFEVVDGDTGGPMLLSIENPNYKLRINNLDLNARTLTITVRPDTIPTAASLTGLTLVIRQGQAFATTTIQLQLGSNYLTVTDGIQNFETRVFYVDPKKLGTIRVNYKDATDGHSLEGTFTAERLSPSLPFPPLVGIQERQVNPGTYTVIGNSVGYESSSPARVTVSTGQTVAIDLILRRMPLPSPSPSPSPDILGDISPKPPDPVPPVTIVAVDLTFTIQKNDKDDGSVIIADIFLDGNSIATESYGEGVTWKAKTKNDFTLILSTPLLTSDCKRMSLGLRNMRKERGEDTWLMQVIATVKLSDGNSRSIVFESVRLYHDKPFQNNFRCPASRLGPGIF